MRASSAAAAKAEKKAQPVADTPAMAQLKEAIVEGNNESARDETPDLPEPEFDIITVPMPPQAKTRMSLLLMHALESNGEGEPSVVWSTGFSIFRDYDGVPSTQINPTLSDDITTTSPVCESLTEAVQQAAEEAQLWLVSNSDLPGDTCAMAADKAIDDWRRGLGEDDLTEAIFDDPQQVSVADHGVEGAATEVASQSESDGEINPSPESAQRDGPLPPADSQTAAVASQTAAVVSQSTPVVSQTSAIVSPTAGIDAEIATCAERIVKHSAEVSQLKAALKVAKKSWETASDELVELHCQKQEIAAEAKERDAQKTIAAVQGGPGGSISSPGSTPAAIVHSSVLAIEKSSPPSSMKSTEDHASRMAEVFVPDPTAIAADAASASASDNGEWRSVTLSSIATKKNGITDLILGILSHNKIETLGQFADWPGQHPGAEYTMLSDGKNKLTEARYDKVQDALATYWKAHPTAVVVPVVSVSTVAHVATAVDTMEIEDI